MHQSRSNYTNQTSPPSNKVTITTTTTGESNSTNSAMDDSALINQVLGTHSPNGTNFDFKPLVNIVEEILRRAIVKEDSSSTLSHIDMIKLEAKSRQTNIVLMLNNMSDVISKLACEMSFKSLIGGDGHIIALSLFRTVGNYQWEAKLALILAAFALNYGEFGVLAQIYSSNQHAKPMAGFNELNKLIHSVMELTRCIFHFKGLPSVYFSYEIPALVRALDTIPTAVYWNARGIIAFAAQITSLTSMGHEYGISSTEMQSWVLSKLLLMITNLHSYLTKQLEDCHRFIEERKAMDVRESLEELFSSSIDNMQILKILLNMKDDPLPLFNGATKQRVSLEVLRNRNVLLLISGLYMSLGELSILEQIYSELRIQGLSMDALHKVVWVPIVDPNIPYTDAMHMQFEHVKNNMPWYSVFHPWNIDRAVNKFTRDKWNFTNKPIVVVLDPKGRELSPNAMPMMLIWGTKAFPFTKAKEEELWRDETWRLELLINGIDPYILHWVDEEKYILLYAGDKIDWIRKFTSNARAVARAAGIPLEMAYVGKSKNRDKVRRAIATISIEKLSHCWFDMDMIWFFWARLESMLLSKIQLNQADDEDLITLQLNKLLTYEKDASWGLLCRGSEIVTNGHGSTMLQAFDEYDLWKEHIPSRGFHLAFKDYHDKLYVEANNCFRFEFPMAADRLPEGMRCPDCQRLMDKYLTFLCYHGQTSTGFQPC